MDVFVKDGEGYKPLSADYKVLSLSDLESEFVSKTKHKEGVESAVNERFRNHLNKDKAHEDPTVIARVLETHEGGNKADLDKQRAQWAQANLVPVQQELQDKTEKLQTIAGKLKYAQMKETFGSEFAPVFTDRIDPDKPSLSEILIGDRLEFDLNTSSLKVKDSATMQVQDLVKEISKDPKYNLYLKVPPKNVSGHGRPGQDGTPANQGDVLTKKEEVENTAEYVMQFGLHKRKNAGVPAYSELK